MTDRYKVSISSLKNAGIEPREGTDIRLRLEDDIKEAKITEIQKDTVIATIQNA